MEEYQQEDGHITQQNNRDRWAEIRSQVNRPLAMAVIALVAFFGISAVYGLHQRAVVRDLTAQSAASFQSMAQLKNQVSALSAQLKSMNTAPQTQAAPQAADAVTPDAAPETPAAESSPAPATEAAVAPAPKPTGKKHQTVKRHATNDKRYTQLQAQLAEQQKELKDTQQQVEKYRSDMEGNLNSTREELSGGIAKNHDELVVLEKKGERSYYEFELTKSKQFQRVGPLSLSLRKTDTKHKSYDFSMLVDDNELSKKKVNLYEPVTIHTDNASQPVQIIVNHIDKNVVHGYVSAPKYKAYELTPDTSASANPAVAPGESSAHNNGSGSGTRNPQ